MQHSKKIAFPDELAVNGDIVVNYAPLHLCEHIDAYVDKKHCIHVRVCMCMYMPLASGHIVVNVCASICVNTLMRM